MPVCLCDLVFAELQLIFGHVSERTLREMAECSSCLFFFIKAQHFVFIVSKHKKIHLTGSNDVYCNTYCICKIKINRVFGVSFALTRKKASWSHRCDC